jgi:hypothetical protein
MLNELADLVDDVRISTFTFEYILVSVRPEVHGL